MANNEHSICGTRILNLHSKRYRKKYAYIFYVINLKVKPEQTAYNRKTKTEK